MRRVGVDSLPVALFISAFTGVVLALQASYTFTGTVPLYFVGTLVGKTMMLELGPVLAGLALAGRRSEEHTSELQSQSNLVCRLLLEKKYSSPADGASHSSTLSLLFPHPNLARSHSSAAADRYCRRSVPPGACRPVRAGAALRASAID